MTEHKNRILIVEDEVLIAFSVKRMLEPFFLSEIAHDYEEAKLLLSHKLFDLVLIDISLSEKKQGWIWRNSSMIIFRFHSFLQPL
jgi:DNA-binding response OmpR family regulator